MTDLKVLDPKRGRPRALEPSNTVSVWLPTPAHDRLIQLAHDQRQSLSATVRALIQGRLGTGTKALLLVLALIVSACAAKAAGPQPQLAGSGTVVLEGHLPMVPEQRSVSQAPAAPGTQATAGNSLPTHAILYILPSGSTNANDPPVAGPFSQPIANNSTLCSKTTSPLPEATADPKVWRVNDPWHAGLVCEFAFPQGLTLSGPAFRAVSTFMGDCGNKTLVPPQVLPCESPRSPINSAPFALAATVVPPPGPPLAPTFVSLKASASP